MPDRKFLETFPLYRKLEKFVGHDFTQVPKASVKLPCVVCESSQTFLMENEYWEGYNYSNVPVEGAVSHLRYLCTSCGTFKRHFVVAFGIDPHWVMKIGQMPPWEIRADPTVTQMLGEHAGVYRKGLICESQGYGIGAFSYYRRIIEETIDVLLEDVANLLAGGERAAYMEAFEKVKKTRVTQDKIELVKDLLPSSLRPDGLNPLAILHSTLSSGLHGRSDEDCLADAQTIREVLVFLVSQLEVTKSASRSFTDGMRKLLDKRTDRSV